MDWSEILSTPINDLESEALKKVRIHLSSIDASELGTEELRQLFELSRHIIRKFEENERKSARTHLAKTASLPEQGNKSQKNLSIENKNVLKNSDTDESYYIQTIQELNREIAQNVYNSKADAAASDGDSPQPLGIDTKKDLLYKIHIKNKYIKRLLCENDALKDEVSSQKEQILLLNVSLKQTAHKLTKAIGDLLDQKKQNHMTADDVANLHEKINNVREQMTRIEHDKRKYKHDVLYLGDEIQKKINQWNDMLKKKYNDYNTAAAVSDAKAVVNGNKNRAESRVMGAIDHNEITPNNDESTAAEALQHNNNNRLEVNVLSEAISKRNAIISEMEILLMDLTMEISQSAIVINRIVKNLSQRETNFVANLENLRKHLAKLLERRPPSRSEETETQIVTPKQQQPSSHKSSMGRHKKGKNKIVDCEVMQYN